MKQGQMSIRERLCLSCRKMKPVHELIRLTVDFRDGAVWLNMPEEKVSAYNVSSLNEAGDWAKSGRARPIGRSAYFCSSQPCFDKAMKGARLKGALEGHKRKTPGMRRIVEWPLEPQLIQVISTKCTEPKKTCQNTQRKEGSA